MCNGVWKESQTREAALEEHDPDVVDQVLRFFYTGNYDDRIQSVRDDHAEDNHAEGDYLGDDHIDDSVGEQAANTNTLEAVLYLNVKVYVLADYLLADGLQNLALENCTALLEQAKDYSNLAQPIIHALHNTTISDTGLRPQVVRTCASMHESVKACGDLVSVLETTEPLAWYLEVQAYEKQQELQAVITTAEARMSTLKDILALNEQRAIEYEQRYGNAAKLVNSYTECRNSNCDREFGASLDESEPGVLRCKRCRCKHPLSDI